MQSASVGDTRPFPAGSARLRAAAAVVWALAFAGPLAAQRPDPRQPELRRVLAAQPQHARAVWVFFDGDVAHSTRRPALSDDVRRERAARGLPLTDADYPVPERLVRAVERTGARVRVVSRWLRGVSVEADSATVARLARLPGVRSIEPVGSFRRTRAADAPGAAAMAGLAAADSFWGANFDALQELRIPAAKDAFDATGRNVRIGIFDTGFQLSHVAFKALRVLAKRDFIQGDTVVRDQTGDPAGQQTHGTLTLSILAARDTGRLVGPAFDAEYVLAKTEDDAPGPDMHADEDRWVAAAEWAVDTMGVEVISSSLGYRYDFPEGDYPYSLMNGDATPTSRAADIAARKGVVVVNAMGNEGPAPGTLAAPADADSVIAVGALTPLDSVAVFSSRGPSFDGQLKPDVSARGVGVTGAAAGTIAGYTTQSGTSVATPLIAGAAALVRQFWPDLGPIAIRDALRLSGSNRTPNNEIGFGIPDVASAILFPGGLAPSQVREADVNGTVNTVAPTFVWSAPFVLRVTPISYTIQLARDTTFRTLVAQDSVKDASALQFGRPLRPQTGLFWRVVARYGTVTRTSRASGPIAVPHWVRLDTLSGPDTTFAETPRVVLRWTPISPGGLPPFTYDVEILSPSGSVVRDTAGLTEPRVQLSPPLALNTPYRWRVIARTSAGTVAVADTVASRAPFIVRGAGEPATSVLYPNFPNPFPRQDVGGTETHIWFDVGERATIELTIFDLHGRVVRRLAPAHASCGTVTLDAGVYGRTGDVSDCVLTTWDGTDDQGRLMPRGVYILRLRVGGAVQTRHIVFTGGDS